MEYWHDLLTSALVGTERQRPPLPPAGTPLGEALAGMETQAPEATLLAAAGAGALYRRAGRLPETDASPLPAPAEEDAAPLCSPLSARHLEWMLGGKHREVLSEWLAAAAASGLRVPDGILPDLLQAGRQDRALREPILRVAGKRGRWLGAQNREWSYLALEDDEEASWETGTRPARQILLGRLRASDPGRARDLLAQTWAQEGAAERAEFLATFRTGLAPEDEPFLEAALDDRGKTVREVAADLLARLPRSALVTRMRERVAPLVTVRTSSGLLGLGRKTVIEVTPPQACDQAMVRDGVEAKPPQGQQGLGERAWWLMQMVGTVPPRTWSEVAGAAPPDVLEAASRTEWSEALVAGWCGAAERHRDVEWAEALLRHPDAPLRHRIGLVEVLPPDRREALALSVMEAATGPLTGQHPALPILQACRHPWNERLARKVLERVRQRARQPTGYDYALFTTLPEFALRIPPSLADEAGTGWPLSEGSQSIPEWVDRFVSLVQFRRDMLEEIRR